METNEKLIALEESRFPRMSNQPFLKKELKGLNNLQRNILAQWYDKNFNVLDEFSFQCETDLGEDILLKIYKINYFKTINLAINDFVVNVLAEGM